MTGGLIRARAVSSLGVSAEEERRWRSGLHGGGSVSHLLEVEAMGAPLEGHGHRESVMSSVS